MRVVIQGGNAYDLPDAEEIRQIVGEQVRTQLRGVKTIRLASAGPTPAAGTLYVGPGPESGYIWSLRLLSVQLASAGTVLAYVTSSAPGTSATPLRLIANMSTSNTNQVSLFANAQVMLYGDESVYLSATQNISAYFLSAWEVPAEMEAKLL